MRRKAHVQFLGEGVLATASPYPTSRVNPPTDDIPSPRQRADFPRVFRHERTSANRLRETSRDDGGRNACWCGSRAYARLALHRLEEGLADGPSAPGAYREGRRGGQME